MKSIVNDRCNIHPGEYSYYQRSYRHILHTDPTALLQADNPERSKVTPDSGGLRYVFKKFIRKLNALLYPHVQSRSPNNAITLPGEAKRPSNRNM
ncbi:hypothetical protein O181_091178 [Austropuccinia psidii MF-1]|uniref:Uncharacterized protein n=1 Tax=Austropuccinia psidii MF-1 TaxID=1389203 RepID=A0A9Q3P790_9BASI|nr:hypothetical protein [Austropuccinia psidii MF-1]